MDVEHDKAQDDVEEIDFDDEPIAIDLEALVKKARRSHEIDVSDVQALLVGRRRSG